MSTQEAQLTTLVINARSKPSNDLKSVLNKYLYHWPLFLFILIIAVLLATVYIKFAKPTYEIKATILIKDNGKEQDAKQDLTDQIGITTPNNGVENEMEIIKSKNLIGQVVTDLQLWATYKKVEGLFSIDVYNEKPVNLELLNPNGRLSNKQIEIVVKDAKTFFFKSPDGQQQEYQFGKQYTSDFGTWKIEPTATVNQFKGSEIKIILNDPDKATLDYQKLIDASLANKLATSVNLTITDKVPQRGKDILNDLIRNYNLWSSNEKNKEAKSTLQFLDERIASLTGELSESEKGIEGFKSSRGLTDLSSDSKVRLENLQANDANLNDVNIKLNVIDGIERYINANQNTEKAPATLGIVDPALSNSIEKLAQLQLQHDKMAATLPLTNPDFDPINNQIRTAKIAIRENVKNIKEALLTTKRNLQSYNNKFESSVKSMPSEERQYISIKRQQMSKESLYTFLLQKREEVAVKYASTLQNNRVVDQSYANEPKSPVIPAYFMALLCGLCLPAGIIYGRQRVNNKITDVKEITDIVKIPVIAEIPFERTLNSLSINDEDVSAVSEQIRGLRMRLFYLHNERETGRVTLITSSVPNEGKSFVSVNLSSALAFSFRKTIILELDLRKPQISQSFNLSKEHKGITDFLNGKASVAEIIRPSGTVENLRVISCGSLVNNPSELLEKKELKDLISLLREEYDDIIIDSPPVHLVPDATVLSRIADVTLYVIRQGVTEKAELSYINEMVALRQLQHVNIVFNGIDRLKYGYGYRFDNNYYNKAKKGKATSIFSDFKNRF
ncbi:GumC family protein [Mucilaginibacter lutimaris]|uniref:non-specific protein-tyrosine kinase n=1 Tax=Mucilaginibacter lutimaris TaxID=931629 RepID=A0ABW2ZLL0_9SPHI